MNNSVNMIPGDKTTLSSVSIYICVHEELFRFSCTDMYFPDLSKAFNKVDHTFFTQAYLVILDIDASALLPTEDIVYFYRVV